MYYVYDKSDLTCTDKSVLSKYWHSAKEYHKLVNEKIE